MADKKIAILGGGSWATALVKILSNNDVDINWWIRKKDNIEYIKKYRHNPVYLSEIEIDLSKVTMHTGLRETVATSDKLIMAIPSAFMSEAYAGLKKEDLVGKTIYSAVKGTLPDIKMMVSGYLSKQFNVPLSSIGIIAGPCHAEEVAMEKLSYLTVGCSDLNAADWMAEMLTCRYIKAGTSPDMQGIEYSAALKNIFAIASGICHGLGYGDNFQAVLVANAIQEIKRFIDHVSPMQRDTNASAYLGDLLVTAYSQFSRNRTLGSMVGKGYSVKYAQLEMNMVAEGYYAVKTIYTINQEHKVDMPITEAVYRILYEQMSPAVEIRLLASKLA
ncbi:MAG TPA: NAD(P)H-dependent glycerol-3-phosphate dehydrogenase [Bacteroidia bacterium]|nr:NAD(P)H-dependent glycerol-3-phosphate dehydrogenase [Bacteroidia bacterium]